MDTKEAKEEEAAYLADIQERLDAGSIDEEAAEMMRTARVVGYVEVGFDGFIGLARIRAPTHVENIPEEAKASLLMQAFQYAVQTRLAARAEEKKEYDNRTLN